MHKLVGLNKFDNITLKRGIRESMELAESCQLTVDNSTPLNGARRTVVIGALGEAGDKKEAFEISKAWRCKYQLSDLNAKGNEVAMESLELCCKGNRRIQQSTLIDYYYSVSKLRWSSLCRRSRRSAAL